jgi:hypothetical protein
VPPDPELERKFGCPEARLYPLLGKWVGTPAGRGVLEQVFRDWVAVRMPPSATRKEELMAYFPPVTIEKL